MHITIDTAEEISELDRSLLSTLIGVDRWFTTPEVVDTTPEEEEPPLTKVKVTKKAAAKPKPEPEPEPMAEEAVEEEPDEEEAGDDEDDQSDEELLTLAVAKATEMVKSGDAAKVREALEAAGASRVRELNKDNVRDFFKALS